MGYRLSKIYTRTGDKGTTGMADGSRLSKDSARMQCIGNLDELNSMLGVVINKCEADEIKQEMISIQHDLFNMGGQLAMPDYDMLDQSRIDWLECSLDKMNASLAPLEEFILPGGAEAACFCHMARTICRRTERSLVTLNTETAIKAALLAYINRLSDWLFVAGRMINKVEQTDEVYWQSERLKKNAGE